MCPAWRSRSFRSGWSGPFSCHAGRRDLSDLARVELREPDVAVRSGRERTRESNRHLAFGGGVHRCLGSHLARREMRVVLREWHRRIPEYELKPGIELEYATGLRSVENLELVWPAR